jgi:branched-chain amino acid transport system permease protein
MTKIEFFQQLINGLSLGSFYALIALGYTMVYGVLRFINFAHGDVFMLGAFGGYYLAPLLLPTVGRHPISCSFAVLGVLAIVILLCAAFRLLTRKSLAILLGTLGILAAAIGLLTRTGLVSADTMGVLCGVSAVLLLTMVLCALVGIIIEKLAYRPLRQRPKLTVLITAIGVSLFLEYGGQFVFGADPKPFPDLFTDQPLEGTGDLTITTSQVTVFAVTIFLLAALSFIVKRTKMGMAMRAVSNNATAAALMGVNTDTVISFTFGLGSALAGAAGILFSISYPSIDPLMGVLPGIKAFVAAVLGGIGNIPGAALGGVIIGVVETFVGGSSFSTYRDAIAFAVLILILLFKPGGLLGKAQVEKV